MFRRFAKATTVVSLNIPVASCSQKDAAEQTTASTPKVPMEEVRHFFVDNLLGNPINREMIAQFQAKDPRCG